MTNTDPREVWSINDVSPIVLGPVDEVMVSISDFHGGVKPLIA
jgi:hypothetical protein